MPRYSEPREVKPEVRFELEWSGVAEARLPAGSSAVALAETEALAKVGRPGDGGRKPIPRSHPVPT